MKPGHQPAWSRRPTILLDLLGENTLELFHVWTRFYRFLTCLYDSAHMQKQILFSSERAKRNGFVLRHKWRHDSEDGVWSFPLISGVKQHFWLLRAQNWDTDNELTHVEIYMAWGVPYIYVTTEGIIFCIGDTVWHISPLDTRPWRRLRPWRWLRRSVCTADFRTLRLKWTSSSPTNQIDGLWEEWRTPSMLSWITHQRRRPKGWIILKRRGDGVGYTSSLLPSKPYCVAQRTPPKNSDHM